MIEGVKPEDVEHLKTQLLSDFFDENNECKAKGVCAECKEAREKIKALATEEKKDTEAVPIAQKITTQIINVAQKIEDIDQITAAVAKVSISAPPKPANIVEKLKKIQQNAEAFETLKREHEKLQAEHRETKSGYKTALEGKKVLAEELQKARNDNEAQSALLEAIKSDNENMSRSRREYEKEAMKLRDQLKAQTGLNEAWVGKLTALEQEKAELAAKLKQSEDTVKMISEFIKD